jgi:amino acid transporter
MASSEHGAGRLPLLNGGSSNRTRVVVATTVLLSFISFWRAAAIVLNDLASSAFYAPGIAEKAIGLSAPWFILAVMLFSYAVRAVYVESCAMFTRGGVYRVVKEAMGGTLAKLSVSALMFDYILTGPISATSAGQYIVGLVAQTVSYFGHPLNPSKQTVNLISASIAVLVILYFWRRNIRGLHESSGDALRIMYVTTAMVVIMLIWSGITIATRPQTQRIPPAPTSENLVFSPDAAGWMPDLLPSAFRDVPAAASQQSAPSATSPTSAAPAPAGGTTSTAEVTPEKHVGFVPNAGLLIGLIGILMAFGHSVLAMSGEETLAQVNRELEHPKHKNLMRAGLIIFAYSLVFTSMVAFLGYAIIPDNQRLGYADNLISGIAMNAAGPQVLKLVFQAFIVIVGFLVLSGAVNTAIVGSNGVLNRVSEDGVLTDWFRAPHRRFGTTYRMIDLIVALQLITVVGSRGNVYVLGEAYAFGVIWSFALKALAVFVLRFRDKSTREWKVPFNLRIRGGEFPLGLCVIALVLFSTAVVNLITKQVATVSGIAFTAVFFAIFLVSERINERRRGQKAHVEMDQFRVSLEETVSNETVCTRPGNVLCVVRDYNTLEHLRKALEWTDTSRTDLVVLTVQVARGPDAGYENIEAQEVFTAYEQLLFTRVIALAEKQGKHVELLVIPSSDAFQAIALAAVQLDSGDIVAGRSSIMSAEQLAQRIGDAWEDVPNTPPHPVRLRIVSPESEVDEFYLGAHAPRLSNEDVTHIHRLWLEAIHELHEEQIHHGDIVHIALERLDRELHGVQRSEVLGQLQDCAARAAPRQDPTPDT